MEIDHDSLKNLDISRKWAMFIAIIGFIFLGIMIIVGILAGTFLSAFSGGETDSGFPVYLVLIMFVILAAASFFPVLYLFRFSKHAAHAVSFLDKQELKNAIKNLKLYFVYIGVLIIIVLSFYLGALIMAGTSISFLKGLG